MKRRRAIEPSQLGRRRRRRKLIRSLLWLVLFLLLILSVVLISHWSKISVTKVTVLGNEVIPPNEITKVADQDMSGNYLLLFSKRNILLFPKAKIEDDILDQYKRVENISIVRTSPSSIEIKLAERKATGIWCSNIGSATSTCYSIDDTGYIFDKAPEISGESFFTYSGLLNADDAIGKNYLDKTRFQQISKFISDLKKS